MSDTEKEGIEMSDTEKESMRQIYNEFSAISHLLFSISFIFIYFICFWIGFFILCIFGQINVFLGLVGGLIMYVAFMSMLKVGNKTTS